jgi:hypothetical protein
MAHWHIDIPVEEEDIEIIKREFTTYVTRANGLTITITPDNDVPDPSNVHAVIKKLFIHLIMRIQDGNFQRIH